MEQRPILPQGQPAPRSRGGGARGLFVMSIHEPMTMLTDYALAVLGVLFGWRLVVSGRAAREWSRSLWGGCFLAMALAAVAGGTAHGFAPWLGGVEASWIWKLTVFALGFAGAAMLAAAVIARIGGAARTALLAAVVVKLAFYVAWMTVHDDYRFVIYDYAASMLGVLALAGWPGGGRPAGAGWIAAGIAVSFVAAGVQQSGLALHRHFNHNDLYHVIQMAGLYLLYRGGLPLRDRR